MGGILEPSWIIGYSYSFKIGIIYVYYRSSNEKLTDEALPERMKSPIYPFLSLFISELCWKRVGIRTAIMVFCLTVCLILPHFAPIVSLTGGFPFCFVGIIIPIVTYIKLFPPATYIKVIAYIFILGVLALVAGNFGAVLQQIYNLK